MTHPDPTDEQPEIAPAVTMEQIIAEHDWPADWTAHKTWDQHILVCPTKECGRSAPCIDGVPLQLAAREEAEAHT